MRKPIIRTLEDGTQYLAYDPQPLSRPTYTKAQRETLRQQRAKEAKARTFREECRERAIASAKRRRESAAAALRRSEAWEQMAAQQWEIIQQWRDRPGVQWTPELQAIEIDNEPRGVWR